MSGLARSLYRSLTADGLQRVQGTASFGGKPKDDSKGSVIADIKP